MFSFDIKFLSISILKTLLILDMSKVTSLDMRSYRSSQSQGGPIHQIFLRLFNNKSAGKEISLSITMVKKHFFFYYTSPVNESDFDTEKLLTLIGCLINITVVILRLAPSKLFNNLKNLQNKFIPFYCIILSIFLSGMNIFLQGLSVICYM